MELKEFIKNFADQFEETDASAFVANTNFRELDEWSSLSALNILAMVVDEYGVELSPEEMRKATTIQQLFDIINSKL